MQNCKRKISMFALVSAILVTSEVIFIVRTKSCILTLDCFLQIALFYVAVLAGLLHRFPVSFSQV